MSDLEPLARRVDDALRAVDGVVGVYSARPLAARVLHTAFDADAALSSVGEDADGLTVEVSIGVTDAAPSVDTARRAAIAVGEALGGTPASLTVRVSRVVRDAGAAGAVGVA
ncbi:hypothetical protein [Microbacterium sp.]|uniref:hypothetical protein n=1 Tax=Microbacterium sp. TaxID=51671 RepID=UPI001AD3A435|nr:hypothetical protein [Microbacterium sp.]MBN9154813.1 hypothetical protein [Microbacterium sp.]